MDSKSSRNQEIRPIADFKERAIPFHGTPVGDAVLVGSKSANEIIHPFADFRDKAQQHGVATNLPDDLMAQLHTLAEKNRRTVAEELRAALEEHLKCNGAAT